MLNVKSVKSGDLLRFAENFTGAVTYLLVIELEFEDSGSFKFITLQDGNIHRWSDLEMTHLVRGYKNMRGYKNVRETTWFFKHGITKVP